MSKHTPGPWAWYGNTKTKDIHLATVNGGRVFVMGFRRWGMAGAQPTFQTRDHFMAPAEKLVIYEVPHRRDFDAIDHPDAYLIAAAPELLAALEEQVQRCWERSHVGLPDHEADCDKCRSARNAIAKAKGRSMTEGHGGRCEACGGSGYLPAGMLAEEPCPSCSTGRAAGEVTT